MATLWKYPTSNAVKKNRDDREMPILRESSTGIGQKLKKIFDEMSRWIRE